MKQIILEDILNMHGKSVLQINSENEFFFFFRIIHKAFISCPWLIIIFFLSVRDDFAVLHHAAVDIRLLLCFGRRLRGPAGLRRTRSKPSRETPPAPHIIPSASINNLITSSVAVK